VALAKKPLPTIEHAIEAAIAPRTVVGIVIGAQGHRDAGKSVAEFARIRVGQLEFLRIRLRKLVLLCALIWCQGPCIWCSLRRSGSWRSCPESVLGMHHGGAELYNTLKLNDRKPCDLH
jgi:hypothetical protein